VGHPILLSRCPEIIRNIPWASGYDEIVEHGRLRKCFSIFEKNGINM
jgi:hypothetical protein